MPLRGVRSRRASVRQAPEVAMRSASITQVAGRRMCVGDTTEETFVARAGICKPSPVLSFRNDCVAVAGYMDISAGCPREILVLGAGVATGRAERMSGDRHHRACARRSGDDWTGDRITAC